MNLNALYTTVDIPAIDWKTGYDKKNMFIGSCFTENMGNRMSGLKFDVDINPFGILYNPLSIQNCLNFLLENRQFDETDLVYEDGLWHSFFHHGKFSGENQEAVADEINERIRFSSDYIQKAGFLFVTFGTAWVYRHKQSGAVVSNCHKIPAAQFERFRLTIEEIAEGFSATIGALMAKNPELKIVFTVSPIRHWADGAVENQRSKAVLLLAVEQIIRHAGFQNCAYFPSYEILMDELRDYRFYKEDMLHISGQAVDMIWNKFENWIVDAESQRIIPEIIKLQKALNHRPFNRNTHARLAFLQNTLQSALRLSEKKPFPNLKEELDFLKSEIEDIKCNI